MDLIDAARMEVQEYKRTKKFSNISQACEKVWVAFTLVLEKISGTEIENNVQRKDIAYRLSLGELYQKAKNLHVLHYEGSPAANDADTFEDINSASLQIVMLLSAGHKYVKVRGHKRG